MSKMAEVDYDIEQLFLEGLTEKNIAKTLEIPVEMVYDWMKENGISAEESEPEYTLSDVVRAWVLGGVAEVPQEEYSPFVSMNS
jgi:uncharacterized membrane protein